LPENENWQNKRKNEQTGKIYRLLKAIQHKKTPVLLGMMKKLQR
jgi:hypothetical protein